MFRFDAEKSVHFCDGMRRRDFLHAGSLALLGLGLRDLEVLKAAGRVDQSRDVNCIMLMLVGGPSQLDTWDMKPDAPEEIRGPFKPIRTSNPSIEICEHMPRLAAMMDVSVRLGSGDAAGRRRGARPWMLLWRRRLRCVRPRLLAFRHRLPGRHAHDVAVGHEQEIRPVEELAPGGIVDAGLRDGDEPRAVVVHLVLESLARLGVEPPDDELVARANYRLDPLGGDAQGPGTFIHGPYDTRPRMVNAPGPGPGPPPPGPPRAPRPRP